MSSITAVLIGLDVGQLISFMRQVRPDWQVTFYLT